MEQISRHNHFGRTRMWEMLTYTFLQEILDIYHYNEQDMELLGRVASDMRGCMKDQECYELSFYKTMEHGREETKWVDVVITLGDGLDRLQEKYVRTQEVMKQWMLENISSELLMRQYTAINEQITHQTGKNVWVMHFWGSEEAYPLKESAAVLQNFSSIRVRCTQEYCLHPSKSVLYRCELMNADHTQECTSLCDHCKNREKCDMRGRVSASTHEALSR